MTTNGGANTLNLPHDTSLLVYPDPGNLPSGTIQLKGLRLMPLQLNVAHRLLVR